MEVSIIEAQERAQTGKGVARKLRAKALIPAICYGQGTEPSPVSLDPIALKKSLDPAKGFNTVLKLRVTKNAGGTVEHLVLVRDYQVDALKRTFQHVDFIAVKEDQPVHVEVPVVLNGRPVGLKEGGILQQLYRKLDLYALPFAIPTKIEVDVAGLDIGDSIHLADLKLPEGVKSGLDPRTTICSVVLPKEEKAAAVETTAEAAPAAAAPAAGKAPAAGAAPAAGKAAAPAAAAKAPAKK